MNLRKLHKLPPLNLPLHILLLHKMIMHAILFARSRLTSGVADGETEVRGGEIGGVFVFGEEGDDCSFAYAGGTADD